MNNVVKVDFSRVTPDFNKTNEAALDYAEQVLFEWLPNGELRGEEFVALNPTRDDSNAGSFSININTGLWGDFATDDAGAGFISLAEYLFDLDTADATRKVANTLKNIRTRDGVSKPKKISKNDYTPIVPLPDDAPPCVFALPDLGKPSKRYAYRDASGALIMYEGRWDYTDDAGNKKKQIYPISYCDLGSGNRGWRAKAPQKPWPLYQLDLIADEQDADIVVCEGTKSAHAAQSLLPSYICTTPLFGARSPEHTNWNAVKGRNVIIWPDHDDAGAEFANKVKELALAAGAKSICILSIPKDFPKKWDAADARAEDWTKEQTLKFVQAQQRDAYHRKGLKCTTLDEFISKHIKARKMILSPILPERGSVMVHAYRGVGKTHVALGIAHAVATGTKFLNWTAKTPKRVLLLDGEMPEHTLQARLRAMVKNTDVKPPHPGYFRIIAHDFQDEPMPSLSTPEGQAAINQYLNGVDLLILDNLSTLFPDVKENESDSWVPVQKWLLELRRRGIAVLLIHHSGKGKAQRGTSRKEDILDTVIVLDRPEDYKSSEGARFTVEYEKARGIFGDAAESFEATLEIVDGKAVWHVLPVVDEKSDKILELAKQKLSVRKIAEQTGFPSATVQYHITKLKTRGKL